jgi:hypothetical protein
MAAAIEVNVMKETVEAVEATSRAKPASKV